MKKSEHFFLSKIFWHLFTTLFQGFYQFPKCIIAGIVEHSKSHVGTECGQCNYSVKIKFWGFMLQHLEPPVVSILQTQGSSFRISLSTKSPVLFCWDSAIQDSDRAVPQLGDKDIMNTHSADQPSARREVSNEWKLPVLFTDVPAIYLTLYSGKQNSRESILENSQTNDLQRSLC